VKNLAAVREINRAFARLPFSRDYEGVSRPSAARPLLGGRPKHADRLEGGRDAIFKDEIVIAGGLWMPGRKNLAYVYNTTTGQYRPIPAPPYETAYTQGVQGEKFLYLLGGRSAGRKNAKLGKGTDGCWSWTQLEPLPEAEGKGRWLASAGIVPGRWLFLVAGHPTGSPSEIRDRDALPDWRIRLDRPGSRRNPGAHIEVDRMHLIKRGKDIQGGARAVGLESP
jgi:hypothetical protein